MPLAGVEVEITGTPTGDTIALLTLLAAAGGGVLTMFRFVASGDTAVRKELEDGLDRLRTETDLKIVNVRDVESRARHDLNNETQKVLMRFDVTLKEIGNATARKEDFLRLEKTLAEISEKLSAYRVMEAQFGDFKHFFNDTIKAINETTKRMEGFMTKLESRTNL